MEALRIPRVKIDTYFKCGSFVCCSIGRMYIPNIKVEIRDYHCLTSWIFFEKCFDFGQIIAAFKNFALWKSV